VAEVREFLLNHLQLSSVQKENLPRIYLSSAINKPVLFLFVAATLCVSQNIVGAGILSVY
jgi:hypothetical protein